MYIKSTKNPNIMGLNFYLLNTLGITQSQPTWRWYSSATWTCGELHSGV